MTCSNPQSKYRYFSPAVVILYFLAHFGLLLLGNHPFWDDWIVVDAPKNQILDTFRQAGSFFNFFGYLHVNMLAIGPWFYRLATFILYYGIGYYFYVILRRSSLFEEKYAFVAATLFLILPFNLGRGALILFPYTLCLFIFMLAWVVLPRQRFLGLLLFFVSFNTNSLLLFYSLPLIEDFRGFSLKFRSSLTLTSVTPFAYIRHYIFNRPVTVALPLLYYIPKFFIFRPYGFYSGYNESFSVLNLLRAPVYHLKSWAGSVVEGDIPSILVLGVALGLLVIYVRALRLRLNNNYALVVGLFALFLGLFPYYILGYVPSFTGWTSRHQLLMPFGISMLVAHGIGTIRPEGLAKKVLVILIALSVIASAFNSALFHADALKQQAIQQFMANALDASRPELVVVEDRTANALRRTYSFYEINGMLARAVKAQSFFGVPPSEIADYRKGKYDKYFSAHYNAEVHQREPAAHASVVLIDSLSPFKQIYPFGLRACLVDLPFPSSQPLDTSRLDCPPEGWVRLD